MPPLFFKQGWDWMRPSGVKDQLAVLQVNHSTADLDVHVYGRDASALLISGAAENAANPVNLWTGMSSAPVGATVRDRRSYADLTGLAKIRWVIRTSGFHVVRPLVKLADGTMLVGDYPSASTVTFTESEFAVAGIRWIRVDPESMVTKGRYTPDGDAAAWFSNPDLSKVDEIGFVDLMPGSGHGAGGYVNVSRLEVYAMAVKR